MGGGGGPSSRNWLFGQGAVLERAHTQTDQLHIMAKGLQLPAEMLDADTCFHADQVKAVLADAKRGNGQKRSST